MQAVTQHTPQAKITEQTFIDMGMWLTHPEQHNSEQLITLLDEDARLPLITLVNTYWLGGALHNSLKKSNVWQTLDQELKDYLTELEQFYNQRNQGIKQEAIFACQILKDNDIPVVILKGSASLFNGVFKPISNRFMTDIDLLVPEDKWQQATQLFHQHGYTQSLEELDNIGVNHHHAPPLFRQQGGHCCVELHRWALKEKYKDILSTNDVWQQAINLPLSEDLAVLQMVPTQQILLTIAHSELSHTAYQDTIIDWRQLYNLAALVTTHGNQIDWQQVLVKFDNKDYLPVLHAHLFAAEKLLRLQTPIAASNDLPQQHLAECINLYVKRQSGSEKYGHIKKVLNGYGAESILIVYGNKGRFPLLVGRLKHFYHHLNKLIRPKYVKRLIQRIKNS
ncbi:nucleotidyltransferase family protein [Thalassotalea psychrophila]|uniref:Nucleotidyltransferase family protein n=1 Tax=Thalassotalea psychrophila TaxID=3065647 RepID=A0ABY9TQX2_9GAMM|nr:nucleotidyltransferase family protein [Colwelliaceae bacterium SQ149]